MLKLIGKKIFTYSQFYAQKFCLSKAIWKMAQNCKLELCICVFQNALGLELWSMTDHIIFDNFIITDDREVHSSWTAQTWQKKISAEHASISGVR